jgi:hypothetical protein
VCAVSHDHSHSALRSLAVARIAIAALLLVRTTPILVPLHAHWTYDTVPLLGWPHTGWTLTLGPPLPNALVASLCVVRTVAALALLVGLAPAVSGAICGACGLLVLAQDVFATTNTLRLLYLSAIVLAATDCASVASVAPRSPRAPASSQWLVRCWVLSIYAWAAISKLDADWLSGNTLALFRSSGLLRGPLAGALLSTHGQRIVGAWLALTCESALVVLLPIPRTRRIGLALAVAMHLAFQLVVEPDLLGWAMLGLLVVFVDQWPVTSKGHPTAPTRPATPANPDCTSRST